MMKVCKTNKSLVFIFLSFSLVILFIVVNFEIIMYQFQPLGEIYSIVLINFV